MKPEPVNARYPCQHCSGTGVRSLRPELAALLALLRAAGPLTAVEAHAKLKTALTPTAIINQLERLRAYGLVVRSEGAHSWVYQVAKGGE